MAIGTFVDKGHRPTMKEILASIGSRRGLWEELIRFIAEKYRPKGKFIFGGENYGWAFRYRRGGKALTTIYPAREGFVVQIVIGPTQAEEAFRLDLGKKVRKMLEDARPYRDGRWLFVSVRSKRDIDDVQRLLMTKLSPVKAK